VLADIVCLGEALIDFVATVPCGDVGEAPGFVRAAGGAPANVAVGAVRLGCSSAFLGKVGDDPFGRYLERTFRGTGVETSGMVFDTRRRTGLAFVSLAPNGERDFCFFRNPSADMSYSACEVDFGAVDACKAFHFGSITMIDIAPRAATLGAAERARAAGKLVSFDPNLRPPLWPSLVQACKWMRRGVRAAEIVKVSEDELWLLVSGTLPDCLPSLQDVDDASRRFLRLFRNVSFLAVTLGERGCFWRAAAGASGFEPAFKVKAVDTTGAGDGFVAGLLTGLIAGNHMGKSTIPESEIRHLIRRANAVGALTTMQKGAIPALPTAEQVEEFLSQN
jgi:fructokinase